MHIYWQNNPANFTLVQFEMTRVLGFFEDGRPNKKNEKQQD